MNTYDYETLIDVIRDTVDMSEKRIVHSPRTSCTLSPCNKDEHDLIMKNIGFQGFAVRSRQAKDDYTGKDGYTFILA
jgi:hypothetical protein